LLDIAGQILRFRDLQDPGILLYENLVVNFLSEKPRLSPWAYVKIMYSLRSCSSIGDAILECRLDYQEMSKKYLQ
jgi:hypothetical protein